MIDFLSVLFWIEMADDVVIELTLISMAWVGVKVFL